MKRCRTVSCKPSSPNQANQGSRPHNNLQSAHQLRVLTNYKDINGGGGRESAPGGRRPHYERSNITPGGFTAPPAAIILRVAAASFVSMIARINTSLLNERRFNELIS